MSTLFTCGELKELSFNSNEFNKSNELPEEFESTEGMLGEAQKRTTFSMNTKKERNKKDTSNTVGTFKISSSARIEKLNDPSELIMRGISYEDGNISIREVDAQRLVNGRVDGVCISPKCAEALVKNGTLSKEEADKISGQVIILNNKVVNNLNTKNVSSPRAFSYGEDVKSLCRDLTYNIEEVAKNALTEFKRKQIGIIRLSDGTVLSSKGEDVTKLYKDAEEIVKGFNKLDKDANINVSTVYWTPSGFKQEGSNHNIQVNIKDSLVTYEAMLDNSLIPKEIKNKLSPKHIAVVDYLKQSGLSYNNDTLNWNAELFLLKKKAKTVEYDGEQYLGVTRSEYKKLVQNNDKRERAAAQHVISRLKEAGFYDKHKDVFDTVIKYSMGHSQHLRSYDLKGAQPGKLCVVGTEKYVIIDDKK